jgi:hypothetical protein
MKEMLAIGRWRIVGVLISLVVIRVIASIVFRLTGLGQDDGFDVRLSVVTAVDLVCVVLAVIAVVGFVQHGRIYNARVPTE